MNPYNGARIYGPYLRVDGRKHVICLFVDGSRKTVSFPKYLVECNIGRTLDSFEEVHHINGDFTDDSLENLEVVNKRDHAKLHVRRLISLDILCPVCQREFSLNARQINDVIQNRRAGKAKTGPYCSRECAGIRSTLYLELPKKYYSLLSLEKAIFQVEAAKSVEPVVDGNTELGQSPSVETLHCPSHEDEDKVQTTIGN